MPNLVLIRGLPGAGKTTLSEELHEKKEVFMHTETDNYWERPDGFYDFNAKRMKEAHAWNLKKTDEWMQNNWSVAVANTFTQLWEMQKYIDLAEEKGYDLVVYRCMGDYGSVHDVPEATMKKMVARFEDYEGEILVGHDDADQEIEESEELSATFMGEEDSVESKAVKEAR